MGRIQPHKPKTMNTVMDGIIMGTWSPIRKNCGHCGHPTRCLTISMVTMPKGVEADWTIIARRDASGQPAGVVQYIGLGCGCYAKFHRQVAHISDGRKEAITI